jgi:hypothetical protein
MTNDPTPEPAEPRPRPVLAVGITGHRSIGVEGPAAGAVAATLDDLLARLTHALPAAIASEPTFFSTAAPKLRLVGMAAEGADLLCARAAHAHGGEIACVLPFPLAEYRNDFETPAARDLMGSILAAAAGTCELSGTRAEGSRAYERANGVILATIDLLIAVWDGKRANGRAGTGDVVQAAIAKKIPILVVDPKHPAEPRLLVAPGEDMLDAPIAIDLASKPLVRDLSDLVGGIMLPPRGSSLRQGLADLINETPKGANVRVEYPLLLAALRAHKPPSGPARAPSPPWPADLSDLQRLVAWIDRLASYYGLLFRSSATSEFLVIIISSFLAAVVMLTFPDVTGASVFVQTAIGALVLLDVAYRLKRRWHERWLDYRLIAERLRCLRFLHPLGLALAEGTAPAGLGGASWVDWYIQRIERSLGAPRGRLDAATVEDARHQLLDGEIAEQIFYHHRAFGQLGLLERRLASVAAVAGLLTIAVALAFGIWAVHAGGFQAVQWRFYAVILLFVLPAMMSAMNGFRADADLVRLVERSALASMALSRLQHTIRAAAPDYDRVAVAAARTAAIMGQELSEWRFVLASRRVRTTHRNTLGRRHFRGRLQRWLERIGLAGRGKIAAEPRRAGEGDRA